MSWIYRLLETRNDFALTLGRVMLGIGMFSHGAQKMLGWWGGGGFSGTMEKMSGMLPPFIVLLVILIEFLGAIFVFLGLLSRPAAAAIVVVMLGAILKVHLKDGFFGFETAYLYLGLALVIMLSGGGALSLDRLIVAARNRKRK